MKRVPWMLSRLARQIGPAGLAGILLLSSGLALYLGLSLPAGARLEKITQDLGEARANRGKMRIVRVDESSPEYRLRKFYAFFPHREDAPQLLEKIYAAARGQSIRLDQGEYKYIPDKSGRLAMYQVSLPVHGSYVGLRKFIVKVLNDAPDAALDAVSFRRESVGSTDLDAKIRFTLFLDDH